MRLLMCLPEYFDVIYEINPWMRITNGPDPQRAQAQWVALYTILTERLGAEVVLITPQAGLPDMVFTANAGLIKGNLFVPSRFQPMERQGEVEFFIRWMSRNGFQTKFLPKDVVGAFEGEGDALFYGDLLLTGFGQRSDETACLAVGKLLGVEVLPLRLTDSRWYHLDTCLIPITPDLLAYYPAAFDAAANAALEKLPGEKILLTESDSLRFGGNAVVAGNRIVISSGCAALAGALRGRGFEVFETDLSEFIKAGGSAKCLVLTLEH
jgi:N-dimethylarginine dimethylaminohydrolase